MAKLLIVDDDQQILELLRTVLTRAGHQVETVDDPQKALPMCSSPASFDLVLSDVEMPVMTGHELAHWIAIGDPGCRVVLMSSLDQSCVTCPNSPVCEVIHKPFDTRELASRITAILQLPSKSAAALLSADEDYLRSGLRLQRQVLEALAAFDRSSSQVSRLHLLQSGEETGRDVTLVLAQARRIHHAANQVYLIALQRYREYVSEKRTLPEIARKPS